MTDEKVTSQRALVYTLTGLLGVMGIAMAMAFKDPCADIADPMARVRCRPAFADHVPSSMVFASMLGVLAAMAVFYELRSILRVHGTGLVGAILAGCGAMVFVDGMPLPLVFALILGGLALVACSVGIHRGNRVAWSFAVSLTATLAVVFFFGSARVQSTLDIPLALAVLPSLAVFLPLTVALATTPPKSIA